MEGSRGHEHTIHDKLSAFREGGEWFKDCPEVRECLASAMTDGVEEWKPKHVIAHTPTMWDQRAKQLCEIICSGRSTADLETIERELSIPSRTLWAIRYRQHREVSVGEYFSLLTAARETIERRRAELDRMNVFLSDLEREEADKTNGVIEAENSLRAVQALVGEEE